MNHKMKTNFQYDEDAAERLCFEYSDNPELLKEAMGKLEIEAIRCGVIPSPWDAKMNTLLFSVTVNGFKFNYYGSHHDAETLNKHRDYKNPGQKAKEYKRMSDSLLYSLLCCIGCDLRAIHEEPEDLGLDPDSIKDMAKWNEIKEHSRKLNAACRLTEDEIDCLPS